MEMRHEGIIKYSIQLTSFADLSKTLRSVGDGVVRLIFFSRCYDNGEYVDLCTLFKQEATRVWGDHRPIITFVAQPTLDSELVIEVHRVEGEFHCRNYEGRGRSISIFRPFGEMRFIGELQGDVVSQSIEQQSEYVFAAAREILGETEPNKIVRQWNYIERITELEGENQHYQLFNNARSNFYGSCSWERGYPAATGIGVLRGGILVDMDVIIPIDDSCKITPIDNKLQVAAHAYSEEVLIDANANKSTPKFERAKSFEVDGVKLTYISGTAAIEGERSLSKNSASEQTIETLRIIDQLIDSQEEIVLLRIYIKNESDYYSVRQAVEQTIDHPIATVYLNADVCREELLVEIEGVEIK